MESINSNTIAELKLLMEDDFQELIESFMDDLKQKVIDLKEHYESENSNQLMKKAHSLKGASYNIGADKLSTLCKTLEEQSAAGDLTSSKALIECIEDEANTVSEQLQNYF